MLNKNVLTIILSLVLFMFVSTELMVAGGTSSVARRAKHGYR